MHGYVGYVENERIYFLYPVNNAMWVWGMKNFKKRVKELLRRPYTML